MKYMVLGMAISALYFILYDTAKISNTLDNIYQLQVELSK